jgi:hypothetical protein
VVAITLSLEVVSIHPSNSPNPKKYQSTANKKNLNRNKKLERNKKEGEKQKKRKKEKRSSNADRRGASSPAGRHPVSKSSSRSTSSSQLVVVVVQIWSSSRFGRQTTMAADLFLLRCLGARRRPLFPLPPPRVLGLALSFRRTRILCWPPSSHPTASLTSSSLFSHGERGDAIHIVARPARPSARAAPSSQIDRIPLPDI